LGRTEEDQGNGLKMKNMKIALRLLTAFTIMVLLAAMIGLVGIRQVNRVWGSVEDIFQHPLQVSNAVRDIQTNITAIHRTMKDVVLSESEDELIGYRLLIAEHETDVYSDFEILFERFLGDISDTEIAYEAFADWYPIREEVLNLYSKGERVKAVEVTKGRGAEHVSFMTEKMETMADFADQKSVEFYQEALVGRNNLMLISIGLLALTILAAVIIGYVIFISTIKPLITMRDRLQELLVENKEQADKIIRFNEHRFNVAIENSPFPVMMHAEDGEVLMLSRSWESISGYGMKDIPNTADWVRKAYPDNGSEMEKYIDGLYQQSEIDINKDVAIRCSDDSYRIWTFNTALLGPDVDGRNVVMSMAVDVTQEKLAEKILEAEREKLSVTLRSIGDGVITTDVNGKIQILNRVAEQLTGWNQADAVGKKLEEVFVIIHEETGNKHMNPIEKVITTGEIIELENHTLLIARDGTERVIVDSGAPIRNKESEIIGVVLVFRDQTEARKLQNRMQKSEKLESLGVLAGGLAHDFNNLLGGLFGYIELAKDVSSEENVKNYLSSAMDVFDRAKGITLQLLTFAKGGDPIRKSIQIDKLVMKNASFILAGTDIAISHHVEDGLWLSNVDENQIGQVVDNLIINARQAMPDGGTIAVKMENVDAAERNSSHLKPGKYVAVSFEDTGKGIPMEIIGKIFDPFFSTKESGNGLGLATCYSIIQRHDGVIDVSSVHGKGSIFTMYLPKADTDSSKEVKTNDISHSGSGLILVLDDERHMRDIVRRIVEDMGYSVMTAGDGDKAMRIVKDSLDAGLVISAALLDLTIPGGIGGLEILDGIKKVFPECIIFATSGYSNNPVMADPAKYGFQDSLHKPYKRQELLSLFSKHFDAPAG
jgi:PAS domain S-box-containing protein